MQGVRGDRSPCNLEDDDAELPQSRNTGADSVMGFSFGDNLTGTPKAEQMCLQDLAKRPVQMAPPSLHLPSPSSVAGACVLLLLPAGASSSSFLQCWLRPPPPSCSVWCVLLLLQSEAMEGPYPLPPKKRWKGLVIAVLGLVILSMLVPLVFLLGLHNGFHSTVGSVPEKQSTTSNLNNQNEQPIEDGRNKPNKTNRR
ncbi:hypothetical protein V2J09_009032 [Rumex salicifolius]